MNSYYLLDGTNRRWARAHKIGTTVLGVVAPIPGRPTKFKANVYRAGDTPGQAAKSGPAFPTIEGAKLWVEREGPAVWEAPAS